MKMRYWAEELPWGCGYHSHGNGNGHGYGYGDGYGNGYCGGYGNGGYYGYYGYGHSNISEFHPSWLITGDEFVNVMVGVVR